MTPKISSPIKLNNDVRRAFEPRYGRSMSNSEVEEIVTNLAVFADAVLGESGIIIQEKGGGEDER